ncbi:MAG: hypothetical protein J0H99_25095 [Rhodospirillales bacterium]|nr:hypothetical protein [Rhodospirillales bacterium]
MSWLGTVGEELVGLFVDDGRFAASIVCWIILCALVLPRIGLPPGLPPILLYLGLAALLIESAVRRAGAGPRS